MSRINKRVKCCDREEYITLPKRGKSLAERFSGILRDGRSPLNSFPETETALGKAGMQAVTQSSRINLFFEVYKIRWHRGTSFVLSDGRGFLFCDEAWLKEKNFKHCSFNIHNEDGG